MWTEIYLLYLKIKIELKLSMLVETYNRFVHASNACLLTSPLSCNIQFCKDFGINSLIDNPFFKSLMDLYLLYVIFKTKNMKAKVISSISGVLRNQHLSYFLR